MKILKACTICKRKFWSKEKPKNREQGEVCMSCRNLLSHIRNIARKNRLTKKDKEEWNKVIEEESKKELEKKPL